MIRLPKRFANDAVDEGVEGAGEATSVTVVEAMTLDRLAGGGRDGSDTDGFRDMTTARC